MIAKALAELGESPDVGAAYLVRAVQTVRGQRDDALAKLAALVEWVDRWRADMLRAVHRPEGNVRPIDGDDLPWRHVPADLTAAATAYRARVRREVLEEAAKVIEARGMATLHPTPWGPCLTDKGSGWCDAARELRTMAKEEP